MTTTLINSLKRQLRPAKPYVIGAATRIRRAYRKTSLELKLASRPSILKTQLGIFLARRRAIVIPEVDSPELSVILAVRDRAELTLACLASIISSGPKNFELIIHDNASTDRTRDLLGRIENVTLIRSEIRLTPPQARNQAASRSRGKFLAFIEPDCHLSAGSIAAALETIRSQADIGVVGGMTLQADGTLEEAGSILWDDGSYLSYGQGRNPQEPEFMFTRDVDFFSGAFFLTAREYYEGIASDLDRVDFSMKLRESGLRSVYDSRVILKRFLRDSRDAQDANRCRSQHQVRIAESHADRLRSQLPNSTSNINLARNRSKERHRVLYIDDRVPYLTLGIGLPRTHRMIAEMVKLGYFVTYFPMQGLPEDWSEIYQCLDRRVEVMTGYSFRNIGTFLENRKKDYDVILVSRPHNMESAKPFLPTSTTDSAPKVIYDAEALFSLRNIEFLRMSGELPSPEKQREMIEAEIRLVEGCSAVLSVSDRESQNFIDHGYKDVFTLSHCLDVVATPNPFEQRDGLLFVGGIYQNNTPNADSVSWFISRIFPRIREILDRDMNFIVAGTVRSPDIEMMGGNGVTFAGRVDDLVPVYNAARIFVAPTRFSAGIPLKCVEAAAYGVPIVATKLLAEQLGWKDDHELLVADGEESFALQCARLYQNRELWENLRANALDRIERCYSVSKFSATLQEIVGKASGIVAK
jgi:glycosyltransferase involved in cell wall biosynthesis